MPAAEEVQRLHREKPHLTHKALASQIGISIHAVKRALKQERAAAEAAGPAAAPRQAESETTPNRDSGAGEVSEECCGGQKLRSSGKRVSLLYQRNGLPLTNPGPDDIRASPKYGKFDFGRFTHRQPQWEMDSDDEFLVDRVRKYQKVLGHFERIVWNEIKQIADIPHNPDSRMMRGVKYQLLSKLGEPLNRAVYALSDRPDGCKVKQWEADFWGLLMRGLWAAWPDYDTPMHMALDFIYVKFDDCSVKLFGPTSRKLFHDIARHKQWPNNPFGGLQMAQAAKGIVQRLEGKPGPPSDLGARYMSLLMGSGLFGGTVNPSAGGLPTPPASDSGDDREAGH